MPTTPSTRGYAPRMSNDRAGRYAEFSWFNDLQVPARDVQMFGIVTTAQAWASQPATDTPLFGVAGPLRKRIDLTGYTQARLTMTPGAVAGSANATLRLQYTTDLTGAAGWAEIDGSTAVGIPPEVGASAIRIDTATASTPAAGAWVTLAAAARADVLIRIVGNSSNGTGSPTFHAASVQFRH
jgi:hypothetical protein